MTYIKSVSITNITGSAIVVFGNTFSISPISTSKSVSGSGSGNSSAPPSTEVGPEPTTPSFSDAISISGTVTAE